MKTLRLLLLSGLVAASVAAPAVTYYRARHQLAEAAQKAGLQEARIAELSADDQRLRDGAAKPADTSSLSKEEFGELLKLRGSIGTLRQDAAEAQRLRVVNGKLGDSTNNFKVMHSPPPSLDHWRREQLVFSGYTSPESALKTLLWAMNTSDMDPLIACMSPEFKAGFEAEQKKEGTSAREAANQMKEISDTFKKSDTYHLIARRPADPNITVLEIFFDGDGKTRKFALSNNGGEWKVRGMGLAGQPDEEMGF